MVGCNYWHQMPARKYGVTGARKLEDFRKLSQYGVKYLRVFPNWRDFQPIVPLMDWGATLREYRVHECDLPQNPYYLDETMLERFGIFCDLAEKYGLKLIVGLITGWMSGRTFIPPALYGKNLASDETALLFQQRFVRGMAERFKDKSAIYAWDLGNECNCLVGAENREMAVNWSMIISNAIKAVDNTRPVVSGMHTIGIEGIWRIADQAEISDILTTHPYPYWCSHCSEGEVTSVQTLMHATCETKYYSNIGGKPCLAEEIGTMGPMVCDDKTSGNFMKLNLYSNWANGAEGVLWWCANEQIDLMFPPYDCNMCEVELGMFDRNGNAKPVIEEVKKFSDWLKNNDINLPKAEDDAVCLATADQDQWGVIYSSYVLAKQAGFNIRFADARVGITDAEVYLMPGISGNFVMPARNYYDLRKRIENGATLYISNNNGVLSDFNNLAGVTVNNSKTKPESGAFELNGKEISYKRERNYIITADRGAEVLARDENGLPIFTKYKYGKGTVYYLNFSLEDNAIGVCDAFDGNRFEVYKEMFGALKDKYAIKCDNKYIGITRHGEEWIVMINYSDKPQKTNATVASGYDYEIVKGNLDEIEPFEMTIVRVTKR